MSSQKQSKWSNLLYAIAMVAILIWIAYTKGWILTNFTSVSPQAALTLLEKDDNVTLLDVRTIPEYKAGHLPEATLIPLDKLESNLAKLPKERQILVYCRSGSRSIVASRILQRHGYTPINIKGGIIALSQAHATIVK